MGRKNSIRAENDSPAEHSSPELHKTRIALQRKRDCSLYSPFYMWLPNLDSNQE